MSHTTSGEQHGERRGDLFDWMISVDDHVLEPPHVWTDRLPKKYVDVGPRLVTDEQGEAWVYEDTRNETSGFAAAAGKDRREFSPEALSYRDMRPGCYDSVARLADMDEDGVLASLCFPTMPRFCGQLFSEGKDRTLGLLCVEAYNDWMIDEWAGSAPGRYIPMIILPLWDSTLAAKEIERAASKGAKAIAFSENPYALGFPSIHDQTNYWDPVWAAAQDADLPICCHIGSSSKVPKTSPDAPMVVSAALIPMNAVATCVDWIFSGIFLRYPKLRLCLSEGGIGWLPYILERCEQVLERQGAWVTKSEMDFDLNEKGLRVTLRESDRAANLAISPLEVFRSNIYGCFIDDEHGAKSIESIGVDNLMVETDFPHTDSNWPNSRSTLRRMLQHLPDQDIEKILRKNAERVFNFVPAPLPLTAS